ASCGESATSPAWSRRHKYHEDHHQRFVTDGRTWSRTLDEGQQDGKRGAGRSCTHERSHDSHPAERQLLPEAGKTGKFVPVRPRDHFLASSASVSMNQRVHPRESLYFAIAFAISALFLLALILSGIGLIYIALGGLFL